MKDLIKWTVYEEKEFPILVGEFQVATKHEFSSKVGRKKIENVKKELTEDLMAMLKELVNA